MTAAKDAEGAPPPSVDPLVAAQATEARDEHPKPKPGWVRHIATDTFHEVEDVLTVQAAYPGQFEDAKDPGKGSKKVGWPEAQEAKVAE